MENLTEMLSTISVCKLYKNFYNGVKPDLFTPYHYVNTHTHTHTDTYPFNILFCNFPNAKETAAVIECDCLLP